MGPSWANQDNGLQLPWRFVPSEIASAFIRACGGQLGSGYGDDTPEHWKSALTAQGFILPEGRAGDFVYAIDRKGTPATHDDAIYEWGIFGEGIPRSRYGQWDVHEDNYKTYLSRYGIRGDNRLAGVPTAVTVSAEVMAKYLYD